MRLEIKNKILKKIKDKNTRSIAIVMHNKPDGDCIGSAVALEVALKKIGKKVVDLIIHDKINERFSPIVGQNRVNKIIMHPEGRKYDLVFMVDFSDPDRTIHDLKKISKYIIVLDHHTSNKPFGDIYACANVSSTGILVYQIIKSLIEVDAQIANAIYLTIWSDTGCFKHANTDSKCHEIVAELISYGADISLINDIYESRSLQFVHLMGSILSEVKVNKKLKISYLIVTREKIKKSGVLDEEVPILIEHIRNIKDVDISLLFVEGFNNVRISARSKKTPVNLIMQHFGGGGHEKAAGCAIEGQHIEDVVDMVLTYIENYLKDKKI